MQIDIKQSFVVVGILAMIGTTSCKKLVEVQSPVTTTSSNLVFSSDVTAAAVLTGIYANMNRISINSFETPGSISLFCGLSADEFKLHPGVSNAPLFYYTNALTSSNVGAGYWGAFYPKIFITNSAIEGISNSTSLTPSVKSHLLGEAKFLRAFFYFYLVNLYGDVPLVLTTDYLVNAVMPRTSKVQVWAQIISDLKDAQSLLSPNYLQGDIYGVTPDRVRPTKWAASALLSRAYLYQEKWTEAETAATTVINNSALFDTVALNNNVFSKGSKEAIWQLQPVATGFNTWDAWVFVIPAGGPGSDNPVYLSNFLLNSFESGDFRRVRWVNNITIGNVTYSYPYKYTSASFNAPVTEFHMVLRLAEQYLIRAEARAKQNNLSGAITDLDVIRKRARLPLIINVNPAISQSDILSSILHERHVELFSEWGHRWFDLKRTGTIDAVMSVVTPQKGGVWNSNWQWYPIAQDQLNKNPFLVQNSGY